MSLTQDLQDLLAQNRQLIPAEQLALMDQAMADLANSGMSNRALNVGDRVPDFNLTNAIGQPVQFQDLQNQGPVVLAFYRGEWCPYCNLELRALQQSLPEIQALGATLVAISPQTPDHSLSTTEKHNLGFEVLSDVGNQVARAFGLVFQLPETLRPIYAGFGIDLPAYNGDRSFELPLPATYVVDRDRTIVHAFVNPDYTQRLDPAEILAVLGQLQVSV